MTSIFNTSYLENVRRIAETDSLHTAKRVTTKKEEKDFRSIIESISNPAQAKFALDPNLKLYTEKELLTNETPPILISQATVSLDTASLENDIYRKVYTESDMNTSLILPELPVPEGRVPLTPAVAQVRRIDLPSHVEKSAMLKQSTVDEEIKRIISTAGKYHGIDENLGLAVAQVESNLDVRAQSRDGHNSKGIFQLLDTTARDMMQRLKVVEPYEPFDPAQNAYLGMGYLKRLHQLFSEETKLGSKLITVPARSAEDLEKLAVAAYNAGEGNVAEAQKNAQRLGKDPSNFAHIEPFLPRLTRKYVAKVSSLKNSLIVSS